MQKPQNRGESRRLCRGLEKKLESNLLLVGRSTRETLGGGGGGGREVPSVDLGAGYTDTHMRDNARAVTSYLCILRIKNYLERPRAARSLHRRFGRSSSS